MFCLLCSPAHLILTEQCWRQIPWMIHQLYYPAQKQLVPEIKMKEIVLKSWFMTVIHKAKLSYMFPIDKCSLLVSGLPDCHLLGSHVWWNTLWPQRRLLQTQRFQWKCHHQCSSGGCLHQVQQVLETCKTKNSTHEGDAEGSFADPRGNSSLDFFFPFFLFFSEQKSEERRLLNRNSCFSANFTN